MSCRLFFAAKLSIEPMLTYFILDPQLQVSVKFESEYNTFCIAFEYVVYELAAILAREDDFHTNRNHHMLQHSIWYIKNNARVTVNNDFWVTSEAICQRFSSRVKIIGKSNHEWPKNRYSRQRMYYFISYTLFYVLEHTILLKTIIDGSFRNCRQGRHFLTSHCDVTTVDLWHHANARY